MNESRPSAPIISVSMSGDARSLTALHTILDPRKRVTASAAVGDAILDSHAAVVLFISEDPSISVVNIACAVCPCPRKSRCDR